MLTIPIWLVLAHWFSDLYCQTDWEASNKSTNWFALLRHVTHYTMLMTVACDLLLHRQDIPHKDAALLLFCGITFVFHFLTDAVTSRINAWFLRCAERKETLWPILPWGADETAVHWFFVSVGFDQFMHYLALAWTWGLLT